MDQARRDKILATMKLCVDAGSENDKDIVTSVKSVLEHPDRIYDIDDSFTFDNSKCMNGCDGKCCSTADIIRISPVDVDSMMRSKQLACMSRKDVASRFLEIFLGRNSLLPMAIIRFIDLGDMKICPFMRFKVNAESKMFGDLRGKIDVKGVCMLGQTRKPAICMLFPLGRMVLHEDGDDIINKNNWVFFTTDCPGTHTPKKIKIRDYIKPYTISSKKNYAYSIAMESIIDELKRELQDKKIIDTILMVFAHIFFYQNGKIEIKIKMIQDSLKEIIDFANEHGQDGPDEIGKVVLCILLALKQAYRLDG